VNKFIKNITLFLAGLPVASAETLALPESSASAVGSGDPDAVSLRPLNRDIDNQFAAHRSHSSHSSHASHASHASHYSGSGSGSPQPSVPATPVLPPQTVAPSTPAAPTTPNYLIPSPSSTPAGESAASLTSKEKLELQVMRVQVKLLVLGLLEGHVDGVFDARTQ